MDTSETYIKMCEGAGEIQQPGTLCLLRLNGELNVGIVPKGDFFCGNVWLARQDQLQEMMGYHIWKLNWEFAGWLFDLDSEGNCDFHVRHKHEDFESMEQLWLAFVMKEKYNKEWNGEDWI